MHGGAQEKKKRAGTENVAGIVGMAVALQEHVSNLEMETTYLNNLRSVLLDALRGTGLNYRLNGADNRVPGSLSISFYRADAENLMNRLDLKNIAVSTGSACNSMYTVLSHVLQAIRIPDEYAYGTIRITLGMDNTPEEMIQIANQINEIIRKNKYWSVDDAGNADQK